MNLQGNVYNTYGLNDMERTGDSSPDATMAKIDLDALKTQYDVLGAFLNGPRLWTLDWIEVPEVRSVTSTGCRQPGSAWWTSVD